MIEELDGQVKRYLGEIRKRGGVVNVAIAIAVGKGTVRSSDSPYKMSSQQKSEQNTSCKTCDLLKGKLVHHKNCLWKILKQKENCSFRRYRWL